MARLWLRDVGKERHWRQLLRQQKRSGQTIRDFCRQRQLSEPSFYAWRREIAKRDRERRPSSSSQPRPTRRLGRRQTGAEPTRRLANIATPRFVPVVLDAESAQGAAGLIEILLSGDRRIRVTPGFDPATLSQVLAVLAGGEAC